MNGHFSARGFQVMTGGVSVRDIIAEASSA